LHAFLLQNHCGHSESDVPNSLRRRLESAVPKLVTISIAIRACFGKPAFEIMQQGRTPAGAKNEAFPEKT